jgi:hypothetical protein
MSIAVSVNGATLVKRADRWKNRHNPKQELTEESQTVQRGYDKGKI